MIINKLQMLYTSIHTASLATIDLYQTKNKLLLVFVMCIAGYTYHTCCTSAQS